MDTIEAPIGLGTYLRALREARSATLEEVARSTRVGIRHLEAIESDTFAELPAPVFVRGFIRAYCGFLGEPAEEALSRYRDLLEVEAARSAAAGPARPAASWTSSPVLVSLALLTVFGLGLLGLNAALKRSSIPVADPAATAVRIEPARASEPAVAAGGNAPATSAPTPSAAAPAPPEKAAPAAQRLVVKALEATWLRVQTDDGRVTEELLPPGATREWTSRKRFVLTVGNAGGIELQLNGRAVPALGARGAVIQRLELPPEGAAPGS